MMSDSEYDRIFALADEGKGFAKIGEVMGLDWRKVKRILESLHKEEKEYHPNSLKDGTKWPEIKKRIEKMYEDDKKIFTWKVIDDIEERFGEKIGARCVAHVRESMGLDRKKERYGFFVKEVNQPKRVDYAVEMKDKKEMFLNVFFADEASVELENESGFVWVKSDDPYGHITPRPKHQLRVMIWVAISMMGAAEVKILGPKESLKSDDYSRIIEEFYLPAAKKLYGFNCRLVHDNASVHVSAFTKKRLLEMGVKTEPWPAESPDMNPVELVFAYLKDRLRNEYKPKNRAELVAAILQFKDKYLTKEYCRSLIRRIHGTMTQVIRRGGMPVRGKKD